MLAFWGRARILSKLFVWLFAHFKNSSWLKFLAQHSGVLKFWAFLIGILHGRLENWINKKCFPKKQFAYNLFDIRASLEIFARRQRPTQIARSRIEIWFEHNFTRGEKFRQEYMYM